MLPWRNCSRGDGVHSGSLNKNLHTLDAVCSMYMLEFSEISL